MYQTTAADVIAAAALAAADGDRWIAAQRLSAVADQLPLPWFDTTMMQRARAVPMTGIAARLRAAAESEAAGRPLSRAELAAIAVELAD